MIQNLRLQNFRSYEDATFEFEPGVTIIVGPNASGKTNLLEALLVVAIGHSYRAQDSELIHHTKTWARLDGGTDKGSRIIKLDNDAQPLKSYKLAGKSFKRLPKDKTLPVVLFEPDHLRLVTGSPRRRRDYLDEQLEQTVVGYQKLRRDYQRVLAQRNRLLKQPRTIAERQLFAWDVRLSQLGEEIVVYRSKLVEKLRTKAPKLYKDISHSQKKISLHYQISSPPKSYATGLLKELEKTRDNDFERGFTGAGPHREDLVIILDGRPAQSSASRGESRTLVLTLKILELQLLEATRGERPLLLLDDVFSELDGARRHALTEFLRPYQTFITTTDADVVVQHFMGRCTIIPTVA